MITIGGLKKILYTSFVISIVVLFFILPLFFIKIAIFILIFINILFFTTDLIKIILFIIGLYKNNISNYYKKDNLNITDNDLPIYTILLPVRNEKYIVINNLLNSLYNLDYPQDKLDIKLIVDVDDKETIDVAQKLLTKFNFDLIIVPDFKVKSKPMSLNYALKFAKGKFLTIYDAEDRPEKYQLRKAIEKFNKLDENVVCLQASLNFYNKYDNILSYYFSIEYSMWFDYTINSINTFATFFPLGGTSNHFRIDKLKQVGGWDGYNMTEDAELGIRLAKANYKISTLNSITEEECPTKIQAWLKQRSRWLKGFAQTFCEHLLLSRPISSNKSLIKNKFLKIFQLNLPNIIIFFTFIGMSFFSFLALIIIIFNNLIYLNMIPNIIILKYLMYANIYIMIIMIYGSFISICIKNKMRFNLLAFIFFPLYWTLHYIASIKSLYELIVKPFYWSKTEHGVSKIAKVK